MSKKIIDISVVILTYNRIKLLKEALNSILIQKYSSFEIIIIDNASTDDTKKTITKYIKKYKNIKYIHLHKNTGVITGRNIGIANANGNIIFLFDDDAELDDIYLFKQIILQFNKIKASCIAIGVYNEDRSQYLGVNKLSDKKSYYTGIFNGGAVFIKKSVFDDIGYFDDTFFRQCEELDFSLRLINKKHYIYFNPNFYIIHKTGNNKNQKLIDYYSFRNKILLIEKNIKGIDKFFFLIRNNYLYFLIFLKIFRLDLWFKALRSKKRLLKENPGYKNPISKNALQNWYYLMKYNPEKQNDINKCISLFEYLLYKIK